MTDPTVQDLLKRGYRYALSLCHDPARAEREAEAAEGSLEDLFADTGIESLPELENRFQLGLAPSGTGKHAVSVLTIAGPAMLIAVGTLGSLTLLLRRPAEQPAS